MTVLNHPIELVTNEQIDHAEAVHNEAGCPTPTCDGLNVCTGCGKYVCPEHTPGWVECVEVGAHHEHCADDCDPCVDVKARDWADDRARVGGAW